MTNAPHPPVRNNRFVFLFGYAAGLLTGVAITMFIIGMLTHAGMI